MVLDSIGVEVVVVGQAWLGGKVSRLARYVPASVCHRMRESRRPDVMCLEIVIGQS